MGPPVRTPRVKLDLRVMRLPVPVAPREGVLSESAKVAGIKNQTYAGPYGISLIGCDKESRFFRSGVAFPLLRDAPW